MKRTGGFQKSGSAGNPGGGNGAGGGGATKRAKFAEDYDEFPGGGGGGFDDEDLGMLDQSFYEKIEGVDDSAEVSEFQSGRWIRPRDAAWDTSKPLLVHWLDLDMLSGQPLEANPAGGDILGSKEGPVPIIRMYGVTPDGYSALVTVHGFTPYFYASLNGITDIPRSALGGIRTVLDNKVR